jgi:formylglycine-generating enzyme required for sulfatase activity
MANYQGCGSESAAVGSLPAGASWCGALGLAGNVSEWVGDWYDEYYSTSPDRNPQGPTEDADMKVIRGGALLYSPVFVRCARRDGDIPSVRRHDVGFRCARDADQ